MRFSQEQHLTLNSALKTWGDYEQYQMLIGELGELLTLFGRRVQGRDTPEEWVTEIADCMIMLEQMAIMHGYVKVQEKLDYKIQRLQSRLPKQNGDWNVKHLENGDFEVIKR